MHQKINIYSCIYGEPLSRDNITMSRDGRIFKA